MLKKLFHYLLEKPLLSAEDNTEFEELLGSVLEEEYV
jgi:hypothetical protein